MIGNLKQGLVIGLAAVALVGCGSSPQVTPSAAASSRASSEPASAGSTRASVAISETSATPPTARSSDGVHLTAQGLGSVPIGAAFGDFARAFGTNPEPMTVADRSIFDDHQCVVRRLALLPGVGFMVTGKDPDGPVRRISIESESRLRTDAGIGVGSALDDVRAAYGPGLDEPFDHYPVGGEAVLVSADAADGPTLLAFIGDERNQVVEIRLGYRPEVLYSEGCV